MKPNTYSNLFKGLFLTVIFTAYISTSFAQKAAVQTDGIYSDYLSKYYSEVKNKSSKYRQSLNSTTGNTLKKFAKWEKKYLGIINRINPEAFNSLNNSQYSFKSLNQEYLRAEAKFKEANIDEYFDRLKLQIAYLENTTLNLSGNQATATKTYKELQELDSALNSQEYFKKNILKRKQELLTAAASFSNSKVFVKLQKECFFYEQRLALLKERFYVNTDIEKEMIGLLDKIPAFKKFFQNNSAVANLFGSNASQIGIQTIPFLQTRSTISNGLRQQVAVNGLGSAQDFASKVEAIKADLKSLSKQAQEERKKLFGEKKPNMQKVKSFKERLEFGTDFQAQKPRANTYQQTTIGLSLGYKLNDKSVFGIGAAYTGQVEVLPKVKIGNHSIVFRSFLDYKIKGGIYITGGLETSPSTTSSSTFLNQVTANWEVDGQIGITKKILFNSKFKKGLKFQFLYSLPMNHSKVDEGFVYRIGYLL